MENIKEDIKEIEELINKSRMQEDSLKLITLLNKYFVNPPVYYMVGEASEPSDIPNFGQCNNIAREYTLQILNLPNTKGYLCQGTVKGNGHIWLELEDEFVFEGVFKRFINKTAYYEFLGLNEKNIKKIPLSEKQMVIRILALQEILFNFQKNKTM